MALKRMLILGMLVLSPLMGQSGPPAATPAERELQAPMTLDDGKPTQSPAEAAPSGWRAVGSLLLVLGLCGGGLYAFRRYGMGKLPGSGGSRLRVQETLALGDRRYVSILKADDETFLIALTPQGVNLIARIHSVEAPAPEAFGTALAENLAAPETPAIDRPMQVRAVEAMMRGERR